MALYDITKGNAAKTAIVVRNKGLRCPPRDNHRVSSSLSRRHYQQGK